MKRAIASQRATSICVWNRRYSYVRLSGIRDMLNFTVGPVMSDSEVLAIGSEQVPYFRTPEFSKVMLQNEELFLQFVDAPDNSRAVFLTGSGTASLEAAVANVLSPKDKALVIVGGSFGKRFSLLCDIHGVPHDDIEIPFGDTLTSETLAQFDQKAIQPFLSTSMKHRPVFYMMHLCCRVSASATICFSSWMPSVLS